VPKTLSGTLDTFSFADLLQWLEINGLSGRVTVTRGDVKRTIDLRGGAIVFVSSSRLEERLGYFLASRGIVPETTVFELLAENFVTGRNLTRLIIERSHLSREKLAEAIESLAIKILLDLFHWEGAKFEFDPTFRGEDLLRISLRGQVLAFHGAKSVDDSVAGGRPREGDDDTEAPWEREFLPETLAGTFWSILESLPSEGTGHETIRDLFYVFNLFASELRNRLRAPFRPLAIFDDTAAMLGSVLEEGGDPDRLLQIVALDPFLTVDVLHLANALSDDPRGLVGTAREAAERIGTSAFTRYLEVLAAPSAPTTSAAERLERAVRRAAVSTAVAATHIARVRGEDVELAYTLGLLEPVGGYDLLKLLMTVNFQPGPFRAAALQRFRALFGRLLARKLNLPRALEDVLGSEGRVTSASPGAEQLVFLAKQLVPAEQIGTEWTSEDPELADRYADLANDPELPGLVARDASALHELLRL